MVNSVLTVIESDDDINLSAGVREDLKKHGLILGDQIGSGTYAEIYYARYKKSRAAVKIVDLEYVSVRFWNKFLPRELCILRHLSKHPHPNIIHVYKVFELNSKKLVVMELAEGGNLLDKIEKRGGFFTEKMARIYFAQIVDGISYLHRNSVAHRDIKLENILLDSQDHIKIADFGFTRFTRNENSEDINSNTFCGTMIYLAPEILKKFPYNATRSDIWSLGVLLYRMLYGIFPFDSEIPVELLYLIDKRGLIEDPMIDKLLTTGVRDLIKEMLQPDPDKRPPIQTIETRPWVSGMKTRRCGLSQSVKNHRFNITEEADLSEDFFIRISRKSLPISTVKTSASAMTNVTKNKDKDDEHATDWENLAKDGSKKRDRKKMKKPRKMFPTLSKIDLTLKDTSPVETNKDTPPDEAKKDTSPDEAKKDTSTGEVTKEDSPVAIKNKENFEEKNEMGSAEKKKGHSVKIDNVLKWLRHLRFWYD